MAEQTRQSFNFSSMDWDAYVKFRPVYPEELYSTIYAYHDSHQGAWDSAVDIGAGVGIVSAELTKRFNHITVTDAADSYVSAAREAFAAFPRERIDIFQAKAEEMAQKSPAGTKFDLATAAECLHWADLDVAVPQIGAVLRPGGTLAAWMYGGRPILAEQRSEHLIHARDLFYDVYDELCRRYATQLEKVEENTGGANMNARLDHMAFAPEAWTDVRRLHARVESPMVSASWTTTKSKVAEHETVANLANQDLLFQRADYEYLEGYLVNWIPPLKVKEFAKAELAKLRRAMGGQKIDVVWPFVLILATKK